MVCQEQAGFISCNKSNNIDKPNVILIMSDDLGYEAIGINGANEYKTPVLDSNDCMNSIERADMSIIGTWRDDIKIDQAEFKEYVGLKGRKYVIDNIVTRCPTNAISLNDDDSVYLVEIMVLIKNLQY